MTDVAAIWLVFGLMVWLINPWGDFPINDDWSWAMATRRLLYHGVWHPTGWTGMTLISHAAWGAGFCAAAGSCSYNVLRASMMALALVALASIYMALGALGRSRAERLGLALTIAVNPIFVALSLSFMTDVSFLAYSLLAMLCLFWALRTGSLGWVVAGTVATVVTVLSRQTGLYLGLAFGAAWLVGRRFRWRTILTACLPLAASASAYLFYDHWLKSHGLIPEIYRRQAEGLLYVLRRPAFLAHMLVSNSIIIATYVGLAAAPFLPIALAPTGQRDPGRILARIAGAGFVLAMAALVTIKHRGMPLLGTGFNIIEQGGLGPHTLVDGLNDVDYPVTLSPAFWPLVTLAGALALYLLISTLGGCIIALLAALRGAWRKHEDTDERWLTVRAATFLTVAAAVYAAPMLAAGYYDRYMLPLFVILPMLLLPTSPPLALPRARLVASGLGLLAMATLTVIGCHDFFAWSRARHELMITLVARGVPITSIEAGQEYNLPYSHFAMPGCTNNMRCEHFDFRYFVRFAPAPGYRIAARIPFGSWLKPTSGYIYALTRAPARTVPET